MGYGNTEVYLTPEQREALVREYLGKTVTVEIDRPIGFVHHTKGITLHYTVNYGFLPGVIGGDGEEQDVYVLGVDEPLKRFTGRIIGAIRRKDDNEDKLIAAPEGVVLHQGQIAEAVHFVEQYFESSIDSLYRKSCGVIPYRKVEGRIEYLLLFQHGSQTWSFPKGHMDAGETELDTALRELREETGLTAELLPNFRETVRYNMSNLTYKDVVLFLGEVHAEATDAPGEIEHHRWVTAEGAKDLLWGNYTQLVDRVEAFLSR